MEINALFYPQYTCSTISISIWGHDHDPVKFSQFLLCYVCDNGKYVVRIGKILFGRWKLLFKVGTPKPACSNIHHLKKHKLFTKGQTFFLFLLTCLATVVLHLGTSCPTIFCTLSRACVESVRILHTRPCLHRVGYNIAKCYLFRRTLVSL